MTGDPKVGRDRTGRIELDDVPLAVVNAEREQIEPLGLQHRRRGVGIKPARQQHDATGHVRPLCLCVLVTRNS